MNYSPTHSIILGALLFGPRLFNMPKSIGAIAVCLGILDILFTYLLS